MTLEDVSNIQLELDLLLPEDYRQVLLHYPFASDAYYDELFGDASYLVDTNQGYLEGSFFGQTWHSHHLIIGDDGAGNVYFLDLRRESSPVLFADHETTAARHYLAVTEKAPNIEAWVQQIRQQQAEAEAEEKAEVERRQNRRWWQFWR